jgi:hypothetical protein
MARSGEKAVEVIAMKRTTSEDRTPRGGFDRTAEPERACPQRLPIVRIRGRLYYQDDRLQEFRAVDDPCERVSFVVLLWAVAILGKWPA